MSEEDGQEYHLVLPQFLTNPTIPFYFLVEVDVQTNALLQRDDKYDYEMQLHQYRSSRLNRSILYFCIHYQGKQEYRQVFLRFLSNLPILVYFLTEVDGQKHEPLQMIASLISPFDNSFTPDKPLTTIINNSLSGDRGLI